MLKNILSSAVSLSLILSGINTALAAGSINAVFDTETKHIEVKGTASPEERVTLKVFSKSDCVNGDVSSVSDDKTAYFSHTYADSDGNFVFKFSIDPSRTKGWYVAAANGAGIEDAECEFIFIDDELVDEMILALNKADEAEVYKLIEDGIFIVLETDETEVAYYRQLDAEYKSTVISSWLASRPDGGYTSKDSANGGFYSACGYAELKSYEPSDSNKAEIEAQIKKIFEGIGRAQLWEKYEGTNSANILNASAKEKTYSDAVSLLKEAETSISFAEQLTDRMILNSINTATSWVGYKDIIDNTSSNNGFAEYIDGIDKTALNKSKSEVLKSVYNSRPAEYTSLSDFVNDINKAAKQVGSGSTSGGSISAAGTGGGGSGSRGSSGSVTVPMKDSTETYSENVTNGFNDMSGYEWAATAVNELSGRNIINGVGDNSFAPGENVTREQFVKMLALTFSLSDTETAEVPFADCSDTDWSYPYIAAAYSRGLVQGMGEEFGKTAPITRQDAAVMVYRFMGEPSAENNGNVFSDYAEISDYAENAVTSMNALGIINGVDNGRFEPKSNMNRAQAAQLLYNVLNALQ